VLTAEHELAKLISDRAELLEALREVLPGLAATWPDKQRKVFYEKARDAIAKATDGD
jgi:hypothetical protein